jgi:hypothetical protein
MDLFVDVLGSSSLAVSNMGRFAPGGPLSARKEASYPAVLPAQPLLVKYLPFELESLGGLHEDALGLLVRARVHPRGVIYQPSPMTVYGSWWYAGSATLLLKRWGGS